MIIESNKRLSFWNEMERISKRIENLKYIFQNEQELTKTEIDDWKNAASNFRTELDHFIKDFIEYSKGKGVYKKSIPDYGTLYTIKEFKKCCKNGELRDYDGYGEYSDGINIYGQYIIPSDVNVNKVIKGYSHILWYNK